MARTISISCALLACFVGSALCGTIKLNGHNKMSITGSASIRFNPPGSLWNGLSPVRRFPVIKNGDLIALKLARSSGTPKWMKCYKSATPCTVSNCPGASYMSSAKFSSCRLNVFRIHARGKVNGEAINSGDHVRLTFPVYGETRHLYCYRSSSNPCYPHWNTSWKESYWFSSTQATFRIFSRNAAEGSPVQYADIVGFKYPYGKASDAWLTYYGSKFYARPCTNGHYLKSYCAKMNAATGFQIYNKI